MNLLRRYFECGPPLGKKDVYCPRCGVKQPREPKRAVRRLWRVYHASGMGQRCVLFCKSLILRCFHIFPEPNRSPNKALLGEFPAASREFCCLERETAGLY